VASDKRDSRDKARRGSALILAGHPETFLSGDILATLVEASAPAAIRALMLDMRAFLRALVGVGDAC
jgi:hypothetical protein